jgi:flagellar hook-associated protein 2
MSTNPIASPVTVSSPGFTGTSKFASGLQQVLSRAVGIASLPLESLNAGLNKLNARESALQGLDTNFSALQIAVTALQDTVNSGLVSASVSDGSVVSASLQAGAAVGVYSVEVVDLGSYSTALSKAGPSPVTDPATQGISTSGSLTISISDVPTVITPESSSLQDLADAINRQTDGQIQATLVNVGSGGTADYRLSLRSAKLGAGAIALADASADLIQTSTPGSLATYRVNGTDPINSDSRTITLSPGLTVNLLAQSQSGHAATISINRNPSAVLPALSSFTQAYNAAFDGLAQQRGQNRGALAGDSLVQSLTGVLSQLGTYNNSSPSNSLANFGIALNKNGHLSIDTSRFTTAANADFSILVSTLGSSQAGGFLHTASNIISSVQDAAAGIIKSEENSVNDRIAAQQTRIANEQATVTQLQANLTAQIAKADAAIASLESQVSYITGLFASFTGATNTQNNGLPTL